MSLHGVLSNNSQSNDAWFMHKLWKHALYRCNSKYLKGKYKHGEKKQAGPKKLHFLQIAVFSSNIFW